MSKPYTTRNKNLNNRKYPITSEITGNTYEVRIKPYGEDDSRYLDGCVVSLRKNNLFKIELTQKFFKNVKGKIHIEHFFSVDTETNWDYNMIEMTKLIVHIYETNEKLNNKSVLQIDKDFEEFKNWDGKC